MVFSRRIDKTFTIDDNLLYDRLVGTFREMVPREKVASFEIYKRIVYPAIYSNNVNCMSQFCEILSLKCSVR